MTRPLLKIDAFKCPQCGNELLRAFSHEGEQAFECTACGHWGTLAWGFQQPAITAITFRPFDAERCLRELEASLPAMRAHVEALNEAKKVSARALAYMITI